uniref:Uncharacterized protein n=1 Tax=Rhizophora mucronata TaxID=61149 RepID=A0A2P2J2S6_RHIMU
MPPLKKRLILGTVIVL